MDLSLLHVLFVGFGLGVRHATDPDHIALAFEVLQRDTNRARAARIAAVWGLGHTLSFLAIGLALVLGGVRLPEGFDVAVELAVGGMLIAFGSWYVWRVHVPLPTTPRSAGLRTFVVGLMHGLAGSSGAALLVTTTMPSKEVGVFYLVLFAIGTAVGMAAVTVSMALAAGAVGKHACVVRCHVLRVTGGISILVGGALIAAALLS